MSRVVSFWADSDVEDEIDRLEAAAGETRSRVVNTLLRSALGLPSAKAPHFPEPLDLSPYLRRL